MHFFRINCNFRIQTFAILAISTIKQLQFNGGYKIFIVKIVEIEISRNQNCNFSLKITISIIIEMLKLQFLIAPFLWKSEYLLKHVVVENGSL